MDFDIGNILYVVITLVAIIASLLGKKKKPAGKNAKPGFFENLEQVLKMGQEDPALTDLQAHEPDLVEEENGYVHFLDKEPEFSPVPEERYQMVPEFEGMASRETQVEAQDSDQQVEVVDLDEFDNPDYFEIVRDFDAGTAVVYSAIINRVNY
jgi:hypothetical protein